MKLPFGLEISLSEKPQSGGMRPAGNVAITDVPGGILADTDYNAEWDNLTKRFTKIETMRRSDGQCKRTEQMIRGPFLSADWFMNPVSDSPEDLFLAEFAKWNFFEAMKWKTFVLPHALLAMAYGFMVFEKVFPDELVEFSVAPDSQASWHGAKTRMVRPLKLYPRMPQSIEDRIEVDKTTGALVGVRQLVDGDEIELPADRLVFVVPEKEGDDWTGRSIFRSADKHHFMKSKIERFVAMGVERFYLPIPVFKALHAGMAEPDVEARCSKMAKKLRGHEQMYLFMPPGIEVEFPSPGSDLPDVQPIIDYHNRQIAAGMLQDFMELGQSKRGARAVGEVQDDPYYMMVQAVAEQLREVFQTYALEAAIDFNFDGVKKYPRLDFKNIAPTKMAELSDSIQKLSAAGFLTPDAETEQHLRKASKLPDKTKAAIEKAQEEAKAALETVKKDSQEQVMEKVQAKPKPKIAASEGWSPARELSNLEVGAGVRFAETNDFLDRAKAEMIEAVRPIRKRQARDLAKKLSRQVVAGRLEPDKVRVADKSWFSKAVSGKLVEAYQYGKRQVAHELSSLKKGDSAEIGDKIEGRSEGRMLFDENEGQDERNARIIAARSDSVSETSSNQLRNAAIIAAVALLERRLSQIDIDIIIDEDADIEEIEDELAEQLDELSEGKIGNLGAEGIMAAMNLGRAAIAEYYLSELRAATLTALLDGNTCKQCWSKDGEQVPAIEAIGVPPFHFTDCAGDSRCRCMWIFEF